MELIIRNKWISLGGSSYVRDINENDLYKVKGKVFSITRKKFLQDLEGKPLYMIRNKFWVFLARKALIYDPEGNIVGNIRRKIFSLHDHYDVESKYGTITLVGNILGFDYHIKLNDAEVGHISRKVSFRDSFVLSINDEVDVPYFIALVIAIDNIVDKIRKDSQTADNLD